MTISFFLKNLGRDGKNQKNWDGTGWDGTGIRDGTGWDGTGIRVQKIGTGRKKSKNLGRDGLGRDGDSGMSGSGSLREQGLRSAAA